MSQKKFMDGACEDLLTINALVEQALEYRPTWRPTTLFQRLLGDPSLHTRLETGRVTIRKLKAVHDHLVHFIAENKSRT